jgi:hypothetical protein
MVPNCGNGLNKQRETDMSIAVATPTINNGVTNMIQNNRQPTNLNDVVRKVRALRKLSAESGFSTNRTVGEMLERLSTDELIKVGELLMLNPTQEGGK